MKKRSMFAVAMTILLLGAVFAAACAPETIVETVEVPGEEIITEVEVPVEVPSKTLVFTSRLFSPPREQEFLILEILKPFE